LQTPAGRVQGKSDIFNMAGSTQGSMPSVLLLCHACSGWVFALHPLAHFPDAMLCCCCRPVRIIPGFLDDVLEDLPPASEQAAVVLVQIGFEICQILFLASYCDLPVIIPIKPCPVANQGLYSSPVKLSLSPPTLCSGPLHKHSLQLKFTP